MTGDLPEAALRLLSQLPVRTHERRLAPEDGRGISRTHMAKGGYQRGKALLFGKGGVARPVRVGKTVYPSASECARKRHISTRDLYDWLRDGRTRNGQVCHYVTKETP